HTHTSTALSSSTQGLAPRGNDPTGELSANRSSISWSLQAKTVFLSAKFARSPRRAKLPQGYSRPSLPFAAYSHSASVGSRYFFRSRELSHWQNRTAYKLLPH